ncbi:NlpC/P60 family protein, partial [Dubosiella newyorkensis]
TPVQPEVSTPEVSQPVETPVQPEVSTPEVSQPVQPEPSGSKAAGIISAALAQVGMTQDCTMLATNALAAVGINFHGWPADYAALGSWTSNPIPGDLIIYSGHIAVYAGNGQAVHGGWYGSQTVLTTVECDKALIGYIRVA